MGDDYELPKAVVNRLVKQALPDNVQIQKEAKTAIAKAAKVFILYATACANDFTLNSNRSTISAHDVLMAMGELEFNDFVPVLQESLESAKKEKESKKGKKKEDGEQ